MILHTADRVLVAPEDPGAVPKLRHPGSACVVRAPAVHYLIHHLRQNK